MHKYLIIITVVLPFLLLAGVKGTMHLVQWRVKE